MRGKVKAVHESQIVKGRELKRTRTNARLLTSLWPLALGQVDSLYASAFHLLDRYVEGLSYRSLCCHVIRMVLHRESCAGCHMTMSRDRYLQSVAVDHVTSVSRTRTGKLYFTVNVVLIMTGL